MIKFTTNGLPPLFNKGEEFNSSTEANERLQTLQKEGAQIICINKAFLTKRWDLVGHPSHPRGISVFLYTE